MTQKTPDVRRALPMGSFDYSDRFTEELDTMKKIQLMDRNAWAKFVNLFKHPGIDDHDHGWRCEYWGKMMRGACFTCQASPDPDLYAVLEETVRDLLTAQDEHGRFSTYSVDAEFHGWDIWGRKYIMLGLLYFLDICTDDTLADEILTALMRHADYMLSKLGREEDGKLVIAACTNNWDGLNSCSILEPFMLLYNRTGEPRYLDFAEYIVSFGGTLHKNLFEQAYEDTTPVHKYHTDKAYEMISCFEGLAEYVKVTGNEKYRQSVIRFGDRVLREEATIIGCLGCKYESFDHAVVEQFNESHQGDMQETCVTVTWMKFLWQLWRMTGDAKYMDAFEISMYNAMSAALKRNIDMESNGGLPIPIHSYNPLRHDVHPDTVGGKKMIDDNSYYGCCVCISTAGYALETLASAAESVTPYSMFINLYRDGIIKTDDITLKVDTRNYESGGDVSFEVLKVSGSPLNQPTLYLRLPAWADRKATFITNGVRVSVDASREYYPGYLPVNVTEGKKFMLSFNDFFHYIHPADVADVPVENIPYLAVRLGPTLYAADDTLDEEPVYDIDTTGSFRTWMAHDHYPEESAVPCRGILKLPLKNGEQLTLVDYPSAGQVPGHKVSAWIKTKA